jgi:hypothetical protein
MTGRLSERDGQAGDARGAGHAGVRRAGTRTAGRGPGPAAWGAEPVTR